MCQRQLRRNWRPCESSLPCDSCGKGEAGQEKGYERLGGWNRVFTGVEGQEGDLQLFSGCSHGLKCVCLHPKHHGAAMEEVSGSPSSFTSASNHMQDLPHVRAFSSIQKAG